MKRAILTAAFCLCAAAGASAQDFYEDADVHDNSEYIDTFDEPVVEERIVRERVIERTLPASDGIIVGSRVYGWSSEFEVEDCGTFRYWNGEYCADARFEPPETD